MNPLVLVTYTFNPGGDQHTDVIEFPSPIASHADLSRIYEVIQKGVGRTVWQIVMWKRFEESDHAQTIDQIGLARR